MALLKLDISREERQFIYAWFNAMLARELSDEQLNALQAGEFNDFFAYLSELGFAEQVAKFQAELTACNRLEFPRLELAADFAQLFLLEGNLSAIPYASAYLNGEALEKNLAEMDRLLSEFGLQVNRESKEPSDHLCVYLTLFDRLLAEKPLEEQQQFLQNQLMSWLPAWFAKAKKVKTNTGVYPALLELFEEVLLAEQQ
ncbi:Chaperone protein TorD [Mannheimia haemolytica]|uniref:Chaperone protein TorD n=1 Tax=Mannheimia haemolytica TaxID=75985 RepID=A0A448T918_MANHA|nr:Chaperone protein TorD [Mannheimia haemolytica]